MFGQQFSHSLPPLACPMFCRLQNAVLTSFSLDTQMAIYTSLQALRAPNPQKVSKKSPQTFRSGVSKKSRQGSESLKKVSKGDFFVTLLETFRPMSRLFDTPDRNAWGEFFETFGGFGPEGRRLLQMAVWVSKILSLTGAHVKTVVMKSCEGGSEVISTSKAVLIGRKQPTQQTSHRNLAKRQKRFSADPIGLSACAPSATPCAVKGVDLEIAFYTPPLPLEVKDVTDTLRPSSAPVVYKFSGLVEANFTHWC